MQNAAFVKVNIYKQQCRYSSAQTDRRQFVIYIYVVNKFIIVWIYRSAASSETLPKHRTDAEADRLT